MKNVRWQLLAIAGIGLGVYSPNLAASKPNIAALNPSSKAPGGSAFTLTVYGSGFSAGAHVNWGATKLTTTFIGASEITAVVPAPLTAKAGTAEVTVTTSGGKSNATVFTIAAGWFDNFESYALGSFPSPNWQASGNNGTSIVDAEHEFSTQSVQLFGELGACWGALIHREFSVTPPFTIEFYARSGNEPLSGCHPFRADAQLLTGPSWTLPNRDLMHFNANGALVIANSKVGAISPLLTWVKVRMTYERPNADTVRISYWFNDQFYKSINVSPDSYESELTWLTLASGEGSAWFENANVSAGLPLLPHLSIVATHQDDFSQGQSGAEYEVSVSNAKGAAPSVGATTVTGSAPKGFALSSIAGPGWTCGSHSCSRSDQLAAGASFPPITETFNVAWNAPETVTNIVSVSGGGSKPANASDPTTVETDNPVPVLTSISPVSAKAGGAAFRLTVNGSNFAKTAIVSWNGSSRNTTYLNATQLMAAIGKSDIANVGTAAVTVVNPSPGGGTSKPLIFGIKGPPPAPVFTPRAGTYASSQNVTITDVAPGATIYYAINPTTTTTYVTYTVPIKVSASETLAAFAIVPNFNPSPTATAAYTIQMPTVKLSATSAPFGDQGINSISAVHPVTLTNTGSTSVSIKSIQLTGADASSFLMEQACGAKLAGGASCKISLFFYPTAAGAETAYVTITDNASGSPQKITLTGTGQ